MSIRVFIMVEIKANKEIITILTDEIVVGIDSNTELKSETAEKL